MGSIGTFALIIIGLAAAIKIFIINPYRGARHIANVVNPNAKEYEKEESKEVIKGVGNQALNYFGFMGTFLGLTILGAGVAMLGLPYAVNLILGIGATCVLFLAYYYFQNRDY